MEKNESELWQEIYYTNIIITDFCRYQYNYQVIAKHPALQKTKKYLYLM